MQLEHDFLVPAPIDAAWAALLDIERVAPCMPGATLESIDGDDFTGKVKVKVGPIQVTYAGKARFAERDGATHTAVIEASGKEARGSGTARATIRTQLSEEGEGTRVKVVTDLAITGKPAQFGRGVLNDVGARILGVFADCLSGQLAGAGEAEAPDEAPAGESEAVPDESAAAASVNGAAPSVVATAVVADSGVWAAATEPVAAVPPESAAPRAALQPDTRPTPDAIDLLDTAGLPVAKRLLPVVAAVLLALLAWKLLRRRSG